MAAAGSLQHMNDAMQAESCAFLKAIHLAEQLGMGRVIFQTDCLPLQQAMSSSSADRSSIGVLIREAKFQLQIGFIEAKLVHQPSHLEIVITQRMCWLPMIVRTSQMANVSGYRGSHWM